MVSKRLKISVWGQRAGVWPRIALFFLGAAFLFSLIYAELRSEETPSAGTNLLVILLVNLNIVILGVLIFLVGRNVVKLIFDRKKKLLGSKLRMRLVVAFVGLALIPTSILFIFASGLLTRSMQGWFSDPVEEAVTGSVEIAKLHYNYMKDQSVSSAAKLAKEIQLRPLLVKDEPMFAAFLASERRGRELFGIEIVSENKEVVHETYNAAALVERFKAPVADSHAIDRALGGETVALYEEQGSSQFVRTYNLIKLQESSPFVLVTTTRIDPEISHALSVVNDSYTEYEQLKLFKNPLRSGYMLTLSMITGLILFSAIWIGFYIAREIAVPVQRLAEGMKAVAAGNYDFQIKKTGDDEIGFLTESFNRMTGDLKYSREEAEKRRLYIETILSNLAIGVLALDTKRHVTSVNAAAARLYGLTQRHSIVGEEIKNVLKGEDYAQIEVLLTEIETGSSSEKSRLITEKQISVMLAGREHKVLCTVGRISDLEDRWLGTVLLFDDITELAKAQQMTAWREVARRIAHEIKNPLTPIQLSAQRLERLVKNLQEESAILECSQTIVENVDSIKRLANEFSHFARMPTAEFKLSNLNLLISDTIPPFVENHPEISFQFIADSSMPDISMDREQVRRIVINLVSNSIAALSEVENVKSRSKIKPRIVIKSTYDKKQKMVRFEVSDNGPGVKNSEKVRIFEPYYTTKTNGTGLGLAIVTSIVSDHQGDIRVYDNVPTGLKFIVELPLAPEKVTQRRFVNA